MKNTVEVNNNESYSNLNFLGKIRAWLIVKLVGDWAVMLNTDFSILPNYNYQHPKFVVEDIDGGIIMHNEFRFNQEVVVHCCSQRETREQIVITQIETVPDWEPQYEAPKGEWRCTDSRNEFTHYPKTKAMLNFYAMHGFVTRFVSMPSARK